MARTPISDVHLRLADDTSAEGGGIVTFPVDTPLRAEYDACTGVLSIESPVVRAGESSGFVLRLQFTPVATSGFFRVLMALEDQGLWLAEQPARTDVH